MEAIPKPIGLLFYYGFVNILMIFIILSETIFITMLLIQLLTVAHVVIQVGNKDDIDRSLKYCHYKILGNSSKIWKCKTSVLYILKDRQMVLQNLLSLQIYTYVQWIKITHVQKIRSFFVFMEWIHLSHG